MANFDGSSGKWIAEGGGQYDERYKAQMAEDMRKGLNSGPTFQSGMLTALWKFFCLIPWLLGVAVGGLCGLILKLGIAGRVILSALVAVFVLIVIGIPANELGLMDAVATRIIAGIVMWAGALAAGAWFWIWHYNVVRQIPYRGFVALTTQCMMICFWGSVVLGIIFAIYKVGGNAGIGIAMGISLIAAVAWWLFHANGYKSVDGGAEQSGSQTGPVPSPVPTTGKRNRPGDLVWARWSQDGNLYFAGIAAGKGAGVRVVYYDGTEEKVDGKDIFYLPEACKTGMVPHGNWEGKGSFYACKILKFHEDHVSVEYIEDKVKENLPYYGLVFMK